jgi:hypothetical protein
MQPRLDYPGVLPGALMTVRNVEIRPGKFGPERLFIPPSGCAPRGSTVAPAAWRSPCRLAERKERAPPDAAI